MAEDIKNISLLHVSDMDVTNVLRSLLAGKLPNLRYLHLEETPFRDEGRLLIEVLLSPEVMVLEVIVAGHCWLSEAEWISVEKRVTPK